MLIQKDLEAKVVTAITTALSTASVSGVSVSGAWATANSGLVKWIEDSSAADAAFVSVSVGCPSWRTFTTPVVDFAANISLFVRPELDPTGSKLVAVSEVIEAILKDWLTNASTAFTALDLTNLSVDSLALGGGASPSLRDGVCSVAWTFTITGSHRAATNN